MINTVIYGLGGKMGQTIVSCAPMFPELNVTGGVDKYARDATVYGKTVYPSLDALDSVPDCIVDFSRPESLQEILPYALKHSVRLVLCTTGYTEKQLKSIENAAAKLPILQSGNMSVGVNTVLNLIERAAESLKGFDIEIIERHHNEKVDAPSGTALMMAEAANRDRTKGLVYGREGRDCRRQPCEIGMHSVRGGTIVGEHEISFIGTDEIVSISHTALSKKIFARGALQAVLTMADKPAGLYTMRDIL